MTIDKVSHLSYSALSSYKACPRRFWLSRVAQAEGAPAWYFAVGTAVHTYIEAHLKGELDSDHSMGKTVEELFVAEVERLLLIEPDIHAWNHGGSQEDPVVGEKALKLAQSCVERAIELLSDIDVWEVELDVSGYLPNCSLPIHGYVDIVGEHKKHGPIIGDWKTGKSKPKDALQLETYKSLLRRYNNGAGLYNDYTFKGMWLMLNPDASQARPIVFTMGGNTLGRMYGEVADKIGRDVYPALVQYNCRFCEQKLNCRAKSGRTPRTDYYDKEW